MGGKAFNHGPDPLYTPRMASETYHVVSKQIQDNLKQLFHRVEEPIPGPAKCDYGDIDLVVASPKEPIKSPKDILDKIGKCMNSVRRLDEVGQRDTCAHFALPWPEGDYPTAPSTPGTSPPSSDAEEDEDVDERLWSDGEDALLQKYQDKFIQVDVRIHANETNLDYQLFHAAHGDIWTILGTLLRPYGFLIDNVGLHLRIEELERLGRKKCRSLITHDPSHILNLLGLDEERYFLGPFETDLEFFDFISRCHYFNPSLFRDKEDYVPKTYRLRKKYAKFFDEYIERETRGDGSALVAGDSAEMTRQEIRQKLFDTEKDVEKNYKAVLGEEIATSLRQKVMRSVTTSLEELQEKVSTAKAAAAIRYQRAATKLIKDVLFPKEGRAYRAIVPQSELLDEDGNLIPGKVKDWLTYWAQPLWEEAKVRIDSGLPIQETPEEQRQRDLDKIAELEGHGYDMHKQVEHGS